MENSLPHVLWSYQFPEEEIQEILIQKEKTDVTMREKVQKGRILWRKLSFQQILAIHAERRMNVERDIINDLTAMLDFTSQTIKPICKMLYENYYFKVSNIGNSEKPVWLAEYTTKTE